MPGAAATKDSTCMEETVSITTHLFQEEETGKKFQGDCLRIISSVSPAKLYCCCAVIAVLTAAVTALSVALSLSSSVRPITESCRPCYATCPRDWIGFGSKCFYFSKEVRSWTFSQTSCMTQEAHLARFDSLEELNFLKRHKGDSDYWIGLHRESPEHSWRWTNNTEYNNLDPIRGEGECAYLSDNGISSGRGYTYRKWICSKPQLSFTRASGF